ncbi:MAG: RNA methyltransferase [Rhizomicrobium sp.]
MSAVICRHFGICGGCAYQDLPDAEYRALKRGLVVEALARQGFADTEVEAPLEVAPATRRRAVFKVAKKNGATLIGFHAAKSHAIVDMQECFVLTPKLAALVPRLRDAMSSLLRENEDVELHVTDTDEGFDVALKWSRARNASLQGEIARLARKLGLARVTAGGDIIVELAKPSAVFGKARVSLPPGSFLQPTRVGEAALQARVATMLKGAKSIADLFAGCGTFALPLAAHAKVHAVDADGAALEALASAARTTQGLKPVTTEKRDLFKRPLFPVELARFDAVVLDPPRAGASVQASQLAASKIARIAYVSCNAGSFSRDARTLADAGYRLGTVLPVDQFLWSSHIELVASFTRA